MPHYDGIEVSIEAGARAMDGIDDVLNNSNIMSSNETNPARSRGDMQMAGLPTYALYGERKGVQATDWLHCETIADRSQHHDWEIRPHRHAVLFQFLYIRSGSLEARIEQRRLALHGPCALWVPPLVPHGFRFADDVDGYVLTVLERHLAQLLRPTPTLRRRFARSRHLQWEAADDLLALDAAMRALVDEFHASRPWRELALDAALLNWVLLLARHVPDAADDSAARGAQVGSGARAQEHVLRFRTLVDERFRAQPTLTALADEMGITPTQLNRCCHAVLGHAALGVLHQRLLLEAQRDLAYTTLSVKQIGLGLGFSDAGYFSRFFRRHTGETPLAWRARSEQAVLQRPDRG